MQEYTRQIAYFYAYEQGRQEAAAGFVKAEVRSGRCRLGIHLNRLGRWEQGAGRVYIYFRQQGRSIGIYLGELEARRRVSISRIPAESGFAVREREILWQTGRTIRWM